MPKRRSTPADSRNLSRRRFLELGAAASAFSILPGKAMGANGKLNVALIGIGGRGVTVSKGVAGCAGVNIVALCDIAMGTKHTAAIEALYPDVPRYRDFRKLFEEMAGDFDACTVATPDHSHFPISMLAMSLNKHIYVEKPLAHTFEECGLMIAAEEKYGVSCQMGNQGHSEGNFHQFKAWQEAGIIKDVTHVDAYMNKGRRWHPWGDVQSFPAAEEMPEGLDWDTWAGTAPKQAFCEKLHPGNWRSWWDYGNGAFGDWGPHTLDTVHRFLDLGLPERVTAVKLEGPNDFIFPMASTIEFAFPARGIHPAMTVRWYDGVDNLPPRPDELAADRKIEACGKIIYSKELTFKGTTHGNTLRVIPDEKFAEVAKDLPPIETSTGHFQNFVSGAMGEEETRSKFAVSGVLSQMFCLGVIAQRLGGSLEFDRETKRFKDNDRANELLTGHSPREGWEGFYDLA